MKSPASFAAGNSAGPVNVAVQRPTVNLREAENVGEQLAAETNRNEPPVQFSKHGKMFRQVSHPGLE